MLSNVLWNTDSNNGSIYARLKETLCGVLLKYKISDMYTDIPIILKKTITYLNVCHFSLFIVSLLSKILRILTHQADTLSNGLQNEKHTLK